MKTWLTFAFVSSVFCNKNWKPESVNFAAILKEDFKLPQSFIKSGFLSVSNVPGINELKEKLFLEQTKCLTTADKTSFVFPDGTERRTFAAKTAQGTETSVSSLSPTDSCAKFSELQSEFRAIVNILVEGFVNSLDRVEPGTLGSARDLLYDEASKSFMLNWAEIVDQGTHLEHFHTYSVPEGAKVSTDGMTFELHKDNDLFIAFTPALVYDNEGMKVHQETSGFFVELDGAVQEVDFSATDLVFMLGEGVEQWLNPKLSVKLSGVAHAMKMPEAGHRAWYGRMVLPKKSVYLENIKATFGELDEELQLAATHESIRKDVTESISICGEGRNLDSRMLQTTCGIDELLCWHSCHAIQPCDDGYAFQCAKDNETVGDCNNDAHNFDCSVQCVVQEITEDEDNVAPTMKFTALATFVALLVQLV